MPIDPQLQNLLASMAQSSVVPATGGMTPDQLRAFYLTVGEKLGGAPRPMAEVRHLSAPGPTGAIALRRYQPEGLTADPQPGMIYVHGGGWVMGSIETHDKICRRLAETCGCIVVSVDYRLAPEHPFPAGPEDVIAASRWIAGNADSLGIDPARLAIAGDSAGGSLSAVACLAHRDSAGPAFCCQILIYPGTDNSMAGMRRPSRVEQAQTPPMPAPMMKAMIAGYLPDSAQGEDWRASPLLAESLADLPPALVITGGFDPLRDEAMAYAQRLAVSGTEVLHRHYAGLVHGFIEMGGVLDAVEDAMQTIAFWFVRRCGKS